MYNINEREKNKGNIVTIMKYFLIILCFLLVVPFSWTDSFEKGKDSFLNNNPGEAALYFEKALSEDPQNENAFMYLGLSYIQSGLTDKAVSSFLKGADLNGVQQGRFYLNAGNAYLSRDQFDDAADLYNLVISGNFAEKSEALLNSANILIKKKELSDAVSLYKDYLVEEPFSMQKDKILQLISLIEKKIEDEAREAERLAAEAERLRLAEEQRKADAAAEAERQRLAEQQSEADLAAEAERQRLAAEKLKAEEAARQQALMDEILNSLSNIGDDTQNISADSETIIHTDEESDIDD